jgi:starvation-inducible DNA-binding protein
MSSMTKSTPKTLKPDLGLSDANREGVSDLLQTVLADEYMLYTKLHNYHWNVTGPQFRSLHLLFEEQYTAIHTQLDEIAERIRTYGIYAIGTMSELAGRSRLNEQPGVYPSSHDMLLDLIADHEAMVRNLRGDLDKAGEEFSDVGAEDFLTGLMQSHQEMAWFLRSMIEGDPVHD